jgi:hypothetical protein
VCVDGIKQICFRPKLHDIGIDAQVEYLDDDNKTSKIIAIQVKSGESYFKEKKDELIIFRPDSKHVNYWLNYSLPVIIVLYNPNDDVMIWTPVHEMTLIKTKKDYKIEIPKDNILDLNTYSILKKIFKLNYIQNRMTKLILDYPWMKMIKDGEVVYLKFEDWVNKTLNRTSLKIFCNSKKGFKKLFIPQIYTPGYSLFSGIQKLIPWADFEMDLDSYHEARKEDYENECLYCYDKESDQAYYTKQFEEYYEEPDDIVPIREGMEVDEYCVILKLNELGEAFLIIADYLHSDPHFELTSFSVNDVIKKNGAL